MFSFKKSLVALVGLLAIVATIVALVPHVSRGQGNSRNSPPPFDVKVINSPSEPVPVTGTVSVSNLGGAPLPVRDVDNAARQPFQAKIIDVPIGIPDPIFFTVPAGKRLVIENVSADIEAAPQCASAPRYGLTTTAGGVTLEHFFYTKDAGTVGSSVNDARRAFGLSQQTRIYADPNTQVRLDIRTGTFPTCGFAVEDSSGIRVSGYLVDVP
jgi:hypothetical protein